MVMLLMFATTMAMLFWSKLMIPATKQAILDRKLDKAAVKEEEIDKETVVTKKLYEGSYSHKEVFVKNTAEKVMMDTGQYYSTHDIFMVQDVRVEVIIMQPSLDLNRTASSVNSLRLLARCMGCRRSSSTSGSRRPR